MAILTGDQGSFTWTDPSGNALVEADFDFWQMEVDRPPQSYRPFGWLFPTQAFRTPTIRGVLRTAVNDSSPQPPIPNGARGTLTLLSKTTGTRQYAFEASLYASQTGANSTTGEMQICNYQFVGNASTSSSTVTVTGS